MDKIVSIDGNRWDEFKKYIDGYREAGAKDISIRAFFNEVKELCLDNPEFAWKIIDGIGKRKEARYQATRARVKAESRSD